MNNLRDFELVKLSDFAKMIGTNRKALLLNLANHHDNYPPAYRIGTSPNSAIYFKNQDISDWIETKKINFKKSVAKY